MQSEELFMEYRESPFFGPLQIKLYRGAMIGNWNHPNTFNGSLPYQILRKSVHWFRL
jgi:hypothetical protein